MSNAIAAAIVVVLMAAFLGILMAILRYLIERDQKNISPNDHAPEHRKAHLYGPSGPDDPKGS